MLMIRAPCQHRPVDALEDLEGRALGGRRLAWRTHARRAARAFGAMPTSLWCDAIAPAMPVPCGCGCSGAPTALNRSPHHAGEVGMAGVDLRIDHRDDDVVAGGQAVNVAELPLLDDVLLRGVALALVRRRRRRTLRLLHHQEQVVRLNQRDVGEIGALQQADRIPHRHRARVIDAELVDVESRNGQALLLDQRHAERRDAGQHLRRQRDPADHQHLIRNEAVFADRRHAGLMRGDARRRAGPVTGPGRSAGRESGCSAARRLVEGVAIDDLARQDVDDRRVGQILQHAHLRRDAGVGMETWATRPVVAFGTVGLGTGGFRHPGGQERHRGQQARDRAKPNVVCDRSCQRPQ